MSENFITYSFLSNVLPVTELDESVQCGYPWAFVVDFSLQEENTGTEVYCAEVYFATTHTAHDDVEKRWRHDYVHLRADLKDIILEGMVTCPDTENSKASSTKKNRNIN